MRAELCHSDNESYSLGLVEPEVAWCCSVGKSCLTLCDPLQLANFGKNVFLIAVVPRNVVRCSK